MIKVSYALREDPNSIFLLQDAGRCINDYCQISVLVRNIVKSDFFGQYLFFAPDATEKYRVKISDVQLLIEDNGYVPMSNYVALIDSEVEFRITPKVIRELCQVYMPALGVKSYLDYFADRKTGFLLFLRVFKTNQSISSSFFEKSLRGSSKILKLYDKNDEDISITIDVLAPVISDNKFSYLKNEITFLLKAENCFIASYDSTEQGLNILRDRVLVARRLSGSYERNKVNHFDPFDNLDSDDDFDMAQLDYCSIFNEALKIAKGLSGVIKYIQNIKPARIGEYTYYLNDLHINDDKSQKSTERLFDMSLRSAVKNALTYHKRYNVDIEDAFQEACIAILFAIKRHHENVSGAFPSYVGMWTLNILLRNLSPYDYNVRVPGHYQSRINELLTQIENKLHINVFDNIDNIELYPLLLNNTDCDEDEACRLSYILSPSESVEEILADPDKEQLLVDENEYFEKNVNMSIIIQNSIDRLSERERFVIIKRFGFDNNIESSLEEIGDILCVTKERVRQIEKQAKDKILKYLRKCLFVSDDY